MSLLRRFWPRRRPRLLALLAFRDEMRFLPEYFANVRPHVDGIVALDDGSRDGSGEYVAAQAEVLHLRRRPARTPHVWDDAANHRLLVEAAWAFAPDWLLGLDADERLERDFRARAEREIRAGEPAGQLAFRLTVRELWDDPLRYRADGIWGDKSSARLFAARPDHLFHDQRLHCHWAPLNSRVDGDFPRADLVFYHLRMLHAEDRAARRRRYESADPERAFQAIGYDYLTAIEGLRLEDVEAHRAYEPLPGRAPVPSSTPAL